MHRAVHTSARNMRLRNCASAHKPSLRLARRWALATMQQVQTERIAQARGIRCRQTCWHTPAATSLVPPPVQDVTAMCLGPAQARGAGPPGAPAPEQTATAHGVPPAAACSPLHRPSAPHSSSTAAQPQCCSRRHTHMLSAAARRLARLHRAPSACLLWRASARSAMQGAAQQPAIVNPTMCDSQVAPMAAARLTTMASDCAGPPQQCYAAGAVANAHSHARRQDQQPSFPAHPKGHMTALKRHNLPTHALKTRLTGLHAAACARMHPRPPPSSAPGLQPQRSVQQPVSARGRSRPHSRARGPAPCAPASARATDAQAGQRRTRHSTRNEPALAAPRMHPLAARCVAR
jgi:hypothetical protein